MDKMENQIDIIDTINRITLARLGTFVKEKESLPPGVRQLLPVCKKEEVTEAESYYRRQINKIRQNQRIIPMERLCEICAYDPLVQRVLELSLVIYSYPQLKEFFRWMGKEDGVTLQLAVELFVEEGKKELSIGEQKRSYDLLRRILKSEDNFSPFFRKRFSMDERVYLYLLGENEREECLNFLVEENQEEDRSELWIHEKEGERLSEYMRDGVSLFHIQGEQGSGKRHLIRYVCKKCDFPLFIINGEQLCRLNPEEIREAVWRLRREILLSETAICISNIKEESKNKEGWRLSDLMKEIIHPLLETGYPVFVTSNPKVSLATQTYHFIGQIFLEPLNRLERFRLWEGFCYRYGIKGIDTKIISSKFYFHGQEIKKISERLAYLQEKEPLTEENVNRECKLFLTDDAMGTLKQEKSPQTLEELKLPQAQKDIIGHIVAHITYRYQVYDQWNLEKKYPYGKTVSALFTGPPGTGKTMAAHVIANMLNLPLYSVDLSQVVDKYIGETQKRLEEIFVAAEKSSSILFFDEADAIFGKRSEVNDSKDRYANAEVAYILQRMEQYDGVVIMASNLQKNIDEAFMRRIRYLVHFEMPGEEVRKELWKSCFPMETPQENIDFDFLAKTFEFSGGSIKNVVLNAVFMAAEEGTGVGMSQIIRSIKYEYIKQGKSIFIAEFGAYGYYLHGSQNG